ncbi:hypothetical protein D9758_008657 [Tetrapyrgos nigripes]|uniref:NADH:flavin oxidoreductase/NADH oxidase N-terminal domain-containing protein n=1 Tax=Tetrapyrgos nigripes TaxID=182062 RepID=A0A8H5FYL2_9AGAR|nr:hypothetical protein D9758_008657 [Tetrapyrgos nigripes]
MYPIGIALEIGRTLVKSSEELLLRQTIQMVATIFLNLCSVLVMLGFTLLTNKLNNSSFLIEAFLYLLKISRHLLNNLSQPAQCSLWTEQNFILFLPVSPSYKAMSSSKLFQPLKLGDITLKHRVALAPLTRFRANEKHVPLPIVKEMYAQRASTPGTLLITEATFIDARAGGYPHVPGIWSDEQIAAWKEVTSAVHAKGSFIYLQLWALGRTAYSAVLKAENPSYDLVSASDIPLSDYSKDGPRPRPLTIPEIKQYVELYAKAALNAVHKAGFDGVEIHNANGYLLDQFTQDVTNHRTDEYGGSVENRARFMLEVVDAVVKAVGPRKTGIRFSPWNPFQDMGMDNVSKTKAQFSYVVSKIKEVHPTFSYIHVLEPRLKGLDVLDHNPEGEDNDFIREIWTSPEDDQNGRRLISAGGYTRELAIEYADKKGDIIAFGRVFIANPDLPYRLEHNIPLTSYDRTTFYVENRVDPKGYTDYPFADADRSFMRKGVHELAVYKDQSSMIALYLPDLLSFSTSSILSLQSTLRNRTMSTSKLFQPLKVGDITLKHRVALAPLTRFRANEKHVPLPIVKEMYAQRASTPGTLLITEATFIDARASGLPHAPGIWSDEQIAAWKEVTSAVHAKGSFIYLQLWALGRSANSVVLKAENPSYDVVSASDIPLSDHAKDEPRPRPLTVPEIKEYVELYAKAASNAVHKAGFDGVEIHNANGFLLDQFTQDVTNHRTDEYGGSVENRARFTLEVVDAVVKAVGPRKTGIRFSPWNTLQDMGMDSVSKTKAQFSYIVSKIKETHPTFSYVHVLEPRAKGLDVLDHNPEGEDNDFIREIWTSSEDDQNGRRLISAGGYTRELSIENADKRGDIIAFGRVFIANPDLPYRLEHNIPLTKYDRTTFYVQNSVDPKGYTDYPFADGNPTMSTSKLFQPLKVGDITLKHRVALAPLTRYRANEKHVPLPIVKEMYAQRASTPGTLLITEATFIDARAGGYPHVPGIWSDEQIAAWKEVTSAVHAKGSFIYLQLYALGRTAYSAVLKAENPSYDLVSASDIPLSDHSKDEPRPRPLTVPEIKEYVELYAKAASNAVHKVGFDGVEIHNANGYLLDQFTQDVTNHRADEYGGSVENRHGLRWSPWNTFQDMGMDSVSKTKAQFSYVVSKIKEAHPTFSYVHVVEPRAKALDVLDHNPEGEDNDFIREIWTSPEDDQNGRRLISAGGYTRELSIENTDKRGDIIAFGRVFIANPDLPYRLEHDISLSNYDRTTFYLPNSVDPKGYTDYPFAEGNPHA